MKRWLERGAWLLLGATVGGSLVRLLDAERRAGAVVDQVVPGSHGPADGRSGRADPGKQRRDDDAAANLKAMLAKLERAPHGSPERTDLIVSLATDYAADHPEKGMKWLLGLDPAGGDSKLAAGCFARRLAEDRPEMWRRILAGLERGQIRDAFVGAGSVGLAKHGVREAWETYLRLRETLFQKDGADWQVFVGLARAHATEFWPIAAEVDFVLIPGDTAPERFFKFAQFEDPADALGIIGSIGEGKRATVMDAYVGSLMPTEKLQWAEALLKSDLDGTLKDRQLATVVDSTMSHAPGEAARLVTAMGNLALKERYSQKLLAYGTMNGQAMERRIREILQVP